MWKVGKRKVGNGSTLSTQRAKAAARVPERGIKKANDDGMRKPDKV